MVLNSESNNPTPPINPTPATNFTAPTNPPPPSSLSRTILTSAPFYLNPQLTTYSHNLTTPNTFGLTGNHQSIFPNYVGMNPIPHVGSSSNQFENLTRPILHLGLGPYPSLSETHLNRNAFFRFGSETNQNENAINSLLQLGLNSNREQTNNNSFLQLGSKTILRDESKNTIVLGHGSSSNREENRDISNSNRFENKGINPNSNHVEKNEFRGFDFHALGLDPVEPVSEPEKNEISLVLGLGSSPNLVENRSTNPGSNKVENKGITPGLNRVEKDEISDLNRNTFFRFGSETNQNENAINSLLQLGLNSNREQTNNNSFLQLGSKTILRDESKNTLVLGHGSFSNRDENRDISYSNRFENKGINPNSNHIEKNEFRGFEFHALGLDPVEPVSEAEKNEISLVLGLGSSSDLVENRSTNPSSNNVENKGISPGLNRVEKDEISDFEFRALALDPVKPVSEGEKNEICLMLGLGSSPNMVENRGINPGSNKVENEGINPGLNRVEKDKTSDFEFRALALDPVKPVSEGEKNEISLVLGFSSSPNQVENRGINSDCIQVEKNFEFCNLALDPVQPISEKPVYKNQNQLDMIQKGKSKVSVGSPVKAEVSGENNDAGESDREDEDKVGTKCSDEESITQLVRTWNLRPRMPRVNPKKQGNNGSDRGGRSRKSATPTRASKPRSAANIRPEPKVERPVMEKRELVISLTKEEIEHDFILMTGEKPPKKLNKRSRAVQKNLDDLFPGMHLTNITPERYNVHDNNAHL